MADLTLTLDGARVPISLRDQGPRGERGASGNLEDNSGNIRTAVPESEFGHRIDVPSSGRALSVFLPDENGFEGVFIDGGGYIRSRKALIVSGWASDYDTSPAGIAARLLDSYRSHIYPSSKQPQMISAVSDVLGPTIQLKQSYTPSVAIETVSRLGYANWAAVGDIGGEQRWFIPGTELLVQDHVTHPGIADGAGYITSADMQIRLRAFGSTDIDGVLLYHKDGGATGAGGAVSHILGPNCSIAGVENGVDGDGVPNGTPHNLIQNEGGVTRIGNATFNTTINASSQTVFEINGVNQWYITGAGLLPLTNGTKNLGSASLQVNNTYQVNAAIVSSDRRLKRDIEDVPNLWLDAWAKVKPRRYKLEASVALKGAAARWHVGYIAQEIDEAFTSVGADATEIGLLCFDKWGDELADEVEEFEVPARIVNETRPVTSKVLGPNGRPVIKQVEHERTIAGYTERRLTGRKIVVREAGEQWAVRYDQAAVLDAALARRGRRTRRSAG